MKSKYLSTFLILVLLVSVFMTGCAGNAEEGTSQDPQEDAQYELILAHALSATSSQNQGALHFADLVKERTDGAVTIKVFADAQLGGEREVFEAQSTGAVDIGIGGGSAIGSVSPVLSSMLSGPYFGISGWEAADEVYYGATGDKIVSVDGGFWGKIVSDIFAENGLTYLGVYDNGFRGISNNKREIKVVDDMHGLKIRVPESESYLRFFESLGAIVTPMAFNELYTALQQGTVDGQDNGIALTYASGFGEVQKYYTELNYMYGALYISISNTSLESLPQKYQDIIMQSALDSCIYHNGIHREEYENYKQKMIEQNVKFYTPSESERQTFIDASASVREWQAEKVGAEYMALWEEYMSK